MPIKVTNYGGLLQNTTPQFNMIDNYIYVHHTSTLIALPTFPEQLNDTTSINYQSTTILGRSAPIYTYGGSGPRSVDFSFKLHRDMMDQINTTPHSAINLNSGMELFSADTDLAKKLQRKDYLEIMIKELQSIALPNYVASEKMVNPPLVSIRIGDELFIKGIVEGSVQVAYSGPILGNNVYDSDGELVYELDDFGNLTNRKVKGKGKYAFADITFRLSEVSPFDAYTVMKSGSLRGLNRTLERNLYKVNK